MSDKQQFLITIDYEDYACRYLFITGIIPYPDWDDDDKRWLTYDEREEVKERFRAWARKQIGWGEEQDHGRIIFIEPCDYVVADSTKDQQREVTNAK